jgi:hypothetical protein
VKTSYVPPAWSWEQRHPFRLLQVDLKDIADEHTLGRVLVGHLRGRRLPPYQWTACEVVSRLRFLAYSREKTVTNGLCFMGLIVCWCRAHGIDTEMVLQTDWGEEFGGKSLEKLARLQRQVFGPLGVRLARIPKGRKEYNGKVERSHRTDDEELYLPFLRTARDTAHLLRLGLQWSWFYNCRRPHSGYGLPGLSPFQRLRRLGYHGSERLAVFPPILLDTISSEWAVTGNDLLTHYLANLLSRTFANTESHRSHLSSSNAATWRHRNDPFETLPCLRGFPWFRGVN